MKKEASRNGARLALPLIAGTVFSIAGCAQISDRWHALWGTPDAPQNRYTALSATGSLAVDIEHPALRDAAIDVLRQALASPNAQLRANAIEALHHAPEHLDAAVLGGFGDENRGVRFIAAMTAGRFQLCNDIHLVRPLLNDDSESVQAAAIFALRQCGEKIDLNPLGQMIASENPEIKANAALVLGELGEPSAIPMLRGAAGRGLRRVHVTRAQIVDLQLAEAIVKLGDESELEVIRASLFAPAEKAEIIALACLMCGRLDDGRAVPNLTNLAMRENEQKQSPEVRMAATLALAQISSGYPEIKIPMEFVKSGRMELRAQAALTLGAMRSPASLNALRQLLADQNPLVQVAAAAGVLQHLDR